MTRLGGFGREGAKVWFDTCSPFSRILKNGALFAGDAAPVNLSNNQSRKDVSNPSRNFLDNEGSNNPSNDVLLTTLLLIHFPFSADHEQD